VADLTTLVDVKRFMGNRTKDHDSLLTTLISAVTAEVEAWLKRAIVQATATDERISVCNPSFYAQTRFFPIIAVSALTEGGTALVEDTDFEMAEHDLAEGLIVRIGGVDADPVNWISTPRAIKVTYTHGYATVPVGIQQAATALVAHDFYDSVPSAKARFGLRSRTMAAGEDVTFLTREEVWTNQLPRLAPHRRLSV